MSTTNQERSGFDPQQLLLQALELRWESYRTELKNCRSEFTEESVHDLRVATRRILALIQLLSSISPRPRLKKMAREFKKQLDEFDELRDTQVILGELSTILPELPQLDEFEQHLRSHEEQMLQDLQATLEQRKDSNLEAWIGRTEADIKTWEGQDLNSLVLDAVDDSFMTVRQRLGWVDLARSATIHRVRVAFKAFRYMVEIVHPLLNDFPPGIPKQMNQYQTLMGNIQDAEVFAGTLADFAVNDSFLELDAVHRYYERRRSDAISAFVAAKDQLYTFWRLAPDRPFPWE